MRIVNQIDRVLNDQCHRTNLLDVRSFRRANADTDHYLLIAGLRGQIARMTGRRTNKAGSKYDRDRLKRPEVKHEYVNKSVTCVEELDKNNINWQTVQQIITENADEFTGKIERAEGNKWYDDECKQATKNKNEVYYRMIQKY
jgi:hypothetical protein